MRVKEVKWYRKDVKNNLKPTNLEDPNEALYRAAFILTRTGSGVYSMKFFCFPFN